MRQVKWSLIFACVLTIAGCGGDSGGDPTPRVQFTSQVVFGDSLSDVGTYAVGLIKTLGGGRYTVNANAADGKPAATNWTELIAVSLGLSAPCPAQTGLDGNVFAGLFVPSVFYAQCTSYAQGGAMITYPYGPGNMLGPQDQRVGFLTVPIVTQINNHLNSHGGAFTGTEIVFLLAGGNDAIVNTEIYIGTVNAGGNAATAAQAAVQAVELAGSQLVGYINNLILAKGAKYVAVLNLPDLSTTPYGFDSETRLAGTQAVMNTMVQAYNNQLKSGLTSSDVLLIDLYTSSVDQIKNPAKYGLTNVSNPACNLAQNFLKLSLICNSTNVIAGDISHYEFADMVHPTPYANTLIALYVAQNMQAKKTGGKTWL